MEARGRRTAYSYDANDRLRQARGPAGTVDYGYDADGNLTRAGASSMSYDQAGRMTAVREGERSTAYRYDGIGNRTGRRPRRPLSPPCRYAFSGIFGGIGSGVSRTIGPRLFGQTIQRNSPGAVASSNLGLRDREHVAAALRVHASRNGVPCSIGEEDLAGWARGR